MSGSRSLLDRINELIESGGLELPVFNAVAMQLQKVVADDNHDIAEVERLIVSDQALSAEILSAANSPFYSGLSAIRTIRDAVTRLGTKQVRRMAVLAGEHGKYSARNAMLNRLLQELWRHSSTTALAAQWLATRLRMRGSEDMCFLGGLLHDIGQLVVLRSLDEINTTEGLAFGISQALIREVLTSAHCQLGYNLLRRWNVPEVYCHIVRDHHSEKLDPGDHCLAVVRLADLASKKLGAGFDPEPTLVLAATPEAHSLRASEILLAELEIMLEDHLSLKV
ncbi:MAG TPA: HDOD domain-containing protein [Acidobacteriota bacterium]|nr:HDOD domain-containing protein [Acidobacteriota bacterium]